MRLSIRRTAYAGAPAQRHFACHPRDPGPESAPFENYRTTPTPAVVSGGLLSAGADVRLGDVFSVGTLTLGARATIEGRTGTGAKIRAAGDALLTRGGLEGAFVPGHACRGGPFVRRVMAESYAFVPASPSSLLVLTSDATLHVHEELLVEGQIAANLEADVGTRVLRMG